MNEKARTRTNRTPTAYTRHCPSCIVKAWFSEKVFSISISILSAAFFGHDHVERTTYSACCRGVRLRLVVGKAPSGSQIDCQRAYFSAFVSPCILVLQLPPYSSCQHRGHVTRWQCGMWPTGYKSLPRPFRLQSTFIDPKVLLNLLDTVISPVLLSAMKLSLGLTRTRTTATS